MESARDMNDLSEEEREKAEFKATLMEAKHGRKNAMNRVGELYENGIGTPESIIKAIFWYQEASLAGNWDAQMNLQSIISRTGCTLDDLREIQYNLRHEWDL